MPVIDKPAFAGGVDPGKHGGMALVQWRPNARPRLVVGRDITGSTARPWYRRAREAAGEICRDLQSYEVTWTRVLFWVEEPPPASRRDALDGDSRGQATWAGIGRKQGLAIAAILEASDSRIQPTLVPAGDWPAVLGRDVAKSKFGDGTHRCREAAFLVEGAKEAIEAAHPDARVDLSEAILIALAALRESRGERAYPHHDLPSKVRRAQAKARRSS